MLPARPLFPWSSRLSKGFFPFVRGNSSLSCFRIEAAPVTVSSTAPNDLISLYFRQFTLIDTNAPAADNALYCSEMLSLDAFALTAVTRNRQDQAAVDPVDFAVDFVDPLGAGM